MTKKVLPLSNGAPKELNFRYKLLFSIVQWTLVLKLTLTKTGVLVSMLILRVNFDIKNYDQHVIKHDKYNNF